MRSLLALIAAVAIAVAGVYLISRATALPPGRQRQLTLATSALGAVVGLIVLARLRREARERPPTDAEMLAEFERAYDAGEMDEAEFRRIEARLAPRRRPPADAPGPPPGRESGPDAP